ncbi:zinc finger protein 385D-like isoform X3 [Sebastes umbrosus]|uniref:zinc finger protein 385D-like isoform X3 n=1 Tax=Sebastes umbrosus TaxID=72105 RepID=UPI0018A11D5B|nr:zinc finger protein 385D-like isoform X3 [Sebastes umbrosus]
MGRKEQQRRRRRERERERERERRKASSLPGDERYFYLTLNKTDFARRHHVFCMCHGALLPLARPTLGRTQPSPDPKPLLPFHLLPGFTDMDHVHKALIGPAFGSLKRKSSSCGVCRLRFNSEAQASSHYSGTKHTKRLKAMDAPDLKIGTSEPVVKETTSQILPSPFSQPSSSDTTSGEPSPPNPPSPPSSGPTETVNAPSDPSLSPSPRTPEKEIQRDGEVEVAPEEETEEEKAIRLLYCSLCKVPVNSASQLQAHNSGTKHKTMLQARSGNGAIKSFPRTGVKAKLVAPFESSTGLQNKTFHCEICDVHVNSETQLKQHISSRRHKDRAAGKPAKPKFSPYTPTQHHQSFQAIRLALRKNQDLTKPLASCLLQRQLSVAAAAAMATLPPFPLRPALNSSPALFQSQPLHQALLHPAPGPICSTHTPVLFSPY